MSEVDISELRERAIDVCIQIRWGRALAAIRALPENKQTHSMRGFVLEAENDRAYLSSLEDYQLAAEYQKRIASEAELSEELEKLAVAERRDRELRSQGDAWLAAQRKAGFLRHQVDQEKHEHWRKWQATETASNPQFAKQSKQEQAKRLKAKYAIAESANTIAKRLAPLPSSKNK